MQIHRAATVALLTLALTAQQAPKPAVPPAPTPASTTQQAPGQAPNSDGVVKFQSASQLVVETVSIKDKSGNTIRGLTAKDFTVTENGKPQVISFCEFQELDEKPSLTPAPVAPPTVIANTNNKPVDSVTKNQIAAEAPGDIKYRDRRLLVLYFDMSAMPSPDQVRALTAAQKFVTKDMSGPDLMAIMEYEGGSVKVKQDFTGDKDLLTTVITKLIVGESQDGLASAGDESDADYGSAFGQDDSEFNIFTTDRQLAALQTAVHMLGQLNEKKSLIYFASGLRLNGVDNQAQMRATTNAAIRSNTSIYSVDARGLVATAPLGDATQGSPGGVEMYSGRSAMAMTNNFQRSQDTMYALAADTGGKALLDNNDLSLGIQNAQKAMSSYYIIGYYTTDATLDGKFRKISITVQDKSAKLEYRVGYYAGKTFNKFTASDKERQLEDALMLGDPITELTVAMEVNYFQLNGAEYFVPVMVKLPGSELALARKSGAEHTRIDFIGEIKDEFNMTVQNIREKMDIKLSDTTAEKLAKSPIQYDTGFTLLPGTYLIKILVRDDVTGRIGTYMNKFVIPNLNKEDKRIPISSVVLSGQRIALKDAIYTAGKEVKAAAANANPLITDGVKLIPSVTKVFSKSRDMYVYLQAYEPKAEKTTPLVAFVSFYRGQTKAFETPPLPVSEGMNNKLKTMPMRFSMALDKLPVGRYICQVTVLDPATQKAAFWQSPIVLVP